MQHFQSLKWFSLVLSVAFLIFFVIPAAAAEKTITGEINDNYQLVADGQIYEIADTPEGNELAEMHSNAKVKVKCNVETRDDMKIITVISYQVISE